MASLPTGIVSFMFTDVEGSTKLWDEHPDEMKEALARHDAILRTAIEAHGGYVFSTAGDAFAAAFDTADGAVNACLDAQLALLAEEWAGPVIRVRMGVHTGSADERDGDYFGPTLNRAARIMSAGHGMQVLVSRTSADLLDGGISLADLGTHRLKDLRDPQHLFGLTHEELPEVDRPLRTVDQPASNLPAYLTTFVGREETATTLEALVGGNRLTVLTGVGGTGKTRLAVETARRIGRAHGAGAWIAELAPITDPGNIIPAIADVWGLRAGEGASIDEVLVRYLWGKDLLLVVDNCEHLLEAATDTISMLLDRCPELRIVATSRESLGIPGEAILRVPSLGLPTSGDEVASTEAGMLFLDRAESAQPGFTAGPADLDAIARIVQRIDGIPLGLELAAARLRSLSPTELANRLEDSFRILSGSAKTALPRQRTLQATIDWSHDLLDERGRALFRRLSVFVGGFDLAAAEAVCAGTDLEDWEVVDVLDALVDQSLVVVVPGEETRYRLLEPIRQYAQERLGPSGEAGELRLRHAHHFAGFAAQTSPLLRGPDQRDWWDRVAIELDNLRAALATLLDAGDLEGHLTLAFDLFTFWVRDGLQVEGIAASLEGLTKVGDEIDAELRVRTWWTAAIMSAEITSIDGIDQARAGLEIAEDAGDPRLIGMAELALGATINHATTDPEYLEHLVRGRELLDEHPPNWWDPVWEKGLINLLLGAYLPPATPGWRSTSTSQSASPRRPATTCCSQPPSRTVSGCSTRREWTGQRRTSGVPSRSSKRCVPRIGLPMPIRPTAPS
ncbi:MAG: adenylate/guanylate cyclase domain-containing protein [Acidimicrobiia bacterium]|nr:adenylate/guanylate cyclase domain-containing protein [Acidimicrobiia bacterium]